MPAITIADLENAKLDVDHIAALATSTAPTATDRLGSVKKTIAGVMIPLQDAATEAIGTDIPTLVGDVQSARDAAISTSIPDAVALVDEAVALTAAGSATAARVAAEAARDSINSTGLVFTAAEGTAAGIAATTNSQQFAVLAADLKSWGIWRNNAGIALFLTSAYTSAHLDSLTKHATYRGWVHVLRSSGSKLGLGISRTGRVILGVGGDIVARITSSENAIASNAAHLSTLQSAFKSSARGSAIFRLLDSSKTKVALEVTRAGRLVSMGRDVLAEIDLSTLLRSFFRVKTGGRGILFAVRDATGKAPLLITGSGRTKLLGRDVLVEVDLVAAQMAALLNNPALISKFVSPSKDITLLGDSQINGAGPPPWRTLIVPAISVRNYRNLAIGGQTSTHIAARFGAIAPLLTVAGNAIPASGPVTITFCRVLKTDGTLDDAFTPITGQGSNTLYGSLAGVLGTWTRASADGAYTFTRAAAGSSVNCPENTPFKPVWADFDLNTLVIGLGRNNITDLETLKRDTEACSDAQRSIEKRQIILTVTNGGSITPGVPTSEAVGTTVGNNVVAYELWAESRFTGPGFAVVNVRKLLMPHHNGSADDLADVAAGTVPRSLRIDSVHYSEAAHQIISDHIASLINAKGW